jgi:NAD(P)-dependent dehydrogenase (short-subunit alcohol dehydrogenase family)
MNDGPVAFITGAARGIGRETALEFARRGYRVALLDMQAELLQEVDTFIRPLGVETVSHAGDLSDLSFAKAAVRSTVDRWGRLDVLVNNAAWRDLVTMRQITPESWQRTLDVCLTAPAFLSRWAAEAMENQKRGVIINVSSMMSQRAGGIAPAYVAAKGGMDALTYELASLYGPSGIRVLAVNPGAVDTDLSGDYTDPQGQSITVPLRQWSEDAIPLRRWATAAEVARAIVALAGDDFSYLTGTTIVLDGGWLHSHYPRPIQQMLDPEQFP